MKLQTLPLAALLVLTFASTGAALPPPCEEAAMEMDSSVIVDGTVSDVICVGEPVANEQKSVTTYESTLQVGMTYKGEEMDSLTIVGTVVEWLNDAEAPVGGWDQPAYPVGTKGKFYLVEDSDNGGYKLVCWNGLIEADDSTQNGDLPVCGGNEEPPIDPPVDPPAADPYVPNDCWADKCSAEYTACAADPSCVAWSLCIKLGADGQACFDQFEVDHPNANIDEQGNHVEYKALQTCGWSSCNDPNAASCAEPGKNGAVNRCDQWDDSWPCNCDTACETYGDCCADKDEVCGGGGEPDPPACTPSCGNKDCGDDGCGGSCGTCQAGFSCSKSQLCIEDEPEACVDACADGEKGCDNGTPWSCAMAGSGCYEKFTQAACAEGATCTDGVCGGGDVPEPQPGGNNNDGGSTSNSDDGGCNTTGSSQTGGIVLLALVLLGLAIRRESDETLA